MYKQVKCIMLGDAAAETNALFNTYIGYPEDPTECSATLSVMVNSEPVLLYLLYLPAASEYDTLRPQAYPGTDVFLLCFAVDSPESFQNISKKWAPEVKHVCPGVPFILVATKAELRDDEDVKKRLKEKNLELVTTKNGQAMAERIGAYAYMECSAKTSRGVKTVFDTAILAALERQSPALRSTLKRSCCLLL
ncbi:ras-related C3 botulinum toxin substrate 1-like [Engraulis encrasicolus]|uniref:ras-related C3 botulinum toxin substrate 1-like n=1 Tax=Engraulis encrasicolus TaxID=184585 RepID=UPI002FD58594